MSDSHGDFVQSTATQANGVCPNCQAELGVSTSCQNCETSVVSAVPVEPQPTTGLSTGQKVHNGLYVIKCVIIGGIATVGGLMVLLQGGGGWPAGLALIAYGVWVLSGIASGGWRLFIY
jgi:hypothetical protein